MKAFYNTQVNNSNTSLTLSQIMKNSCQLIKKSLTYTGVLLALAACDTTIDHSSSSHSMTEATHLGQMQASLQLAPEMQCQTFNLINQDLGTQEFSVDLTQARLINGKYSFRRALEEGEYTFVGQLNCINQNAQAVSYDSFPTFVNITAQTANHISFDFIFNRASDLDTINLQLCAEFILSSFSHGPQACLGDKISANYDIKWITEQNQCQGLALEMSLDQVQVNTQDLQHAVPHVSISIPADQLMSLGTLDILLSNQEGGKISIYQQKIEIVECSDDTPLDDNPHQGNDQVHNSLIDRHQQLEKFNVLSENTFQSCDAQNLRIESSLLNETGLMQREEVYNVHGKLASYATETSESTSQLDFAYDELTRLSSITFSENTEYGSYSGLETITYDIHERPLAVQTETEGVISEYEHVYNLNQQVVHTQISMFGQNQQDWNYTYNEAGQLVELEIDDHVIAVSTLVNYQYDANNRIVSEQQFGIPVQKDLHYYHVAMQHHSNIVETQVNYEYRNGLTYKFSTFFAPVNFEIDDELMAVSHLIEVFDASNNLLHFEFTNDVGETIALYTRNFNQLGQLTSTESQNVHIFFTTMTYGYIFNLIEAMPNTESQVMTVSNLTCE